MCILSFKYLLYRAKPRSPLFNTTRIVIFWGVSPRMGMVLSGISTCNWLFRHCGKTFRTQGHCFECLLRLCSTLSVMSWPEARAGRGRILTFTVTQRKWKWLKFSTFLPPPPIWKFPSWKWTHSAGNCHCSGRTLLKVSSRGRIAHYLRVQYAGPTVASCKKIRSFRGIIMNISQRVMNCRGFCSWCGLC